jgi:TPR repeat protein
MGESPLKILRLFALVLVILLVASQAQAQRDLAAELRQAQKALAAGDYEKAFREYLRFAKEKNNPLAQFSVALFFQYGWGRPADPVAACKWYEKAAKGNIPAAAHFFAECLEQGVGRPSNPALAAAWYEKAAALGHHMSLCSLAELYMVGNGVPKDPARGLELCRKAAEQQVIRAQTRMGLFFLEGDESIRDLDQAFKWFQLAAERNSPEAQYYLAVMLRDGLGRPKTPEVARYWFEMAASQGYVLAYLPTAQLYFNAPVDQKTGKLSEHDLAKAYLWASATLKRSKETEELAQTEKMLEKIRAIMPETWAPTLDAKVAEHLARFPESP